MTFEICGARTRAARWVSLTTLGLALGLCARVGSASEPNGQRVSHFVGAAGEGVPIQVPPFRGIEPRLSLAYSSEARNGFAGMGWNLTGFSVIERMSGGWGFPRFDATDMFTLDGQTLLACPEASPYPSCASGGTHYTQQESFLKIKKVSDVLWEVYGKDGTKTTFAPIHTVLMYEGGPTFALRLGQSQVIDTHGNTVQYNWATNAGGVNGATYPSSVVYNGYRVEFFREARPEGALTRGAWSDVGRQPERLRSVVVRLDSGSKIRAYKLGYTTSSASGKSLLTSVQLYGKDVAVDGAGGITGGTTLPAQTFAYTPDGAVASFTGDVQMSNAGPPPTAAGTVESVVWTYRTNTTPAGDGSTLQADSEVADGWDKVGHGTRVLSSGLGYLEFTYTGEQQFAAYLGAYGVYFPSVGSMTLQGPGISGTGPYSTPVNSVIRIEVVTGGLAFKVGGATVASVAATPSYPMNVFASFYRAGSAVSAAKVSGSLVNQFSVDCGGSPRFYGDFNGDGRQDSVCRTAGGQLSVTKATTAGFSNPTLWADSEHAIAGVGDFNNDGRDDVVFFDSYWGKTYVGLSDGSDFGAVTYWGFMGGSGDGCRFNGATLGKVADYNGDGLMDVACYIPGVDLQYVGLSQANGFVSVLFGDVGCPQPYGNLAAQGQADFNGDGRDDWFCINTTNADLYAFHSTGTFLWFNDVVLSGFCSLNEYSFGDWNGDGATDAACANNLRAGLQTGYRFAVLEAPAPAAYCVTGQRLAADLDGDGSAEWICNNPGSPGNDIEVRRWSGLAFGAAQTWRGGFCAGAIAAADFNGDGKKDLVCESSGSVIYAGTKDTKADLLTVTSNGIGGSSTLAYMTTSQQLPGSTAGLPAKYLVASTTASDGRIAPATTTFQYHTGAQNDKERKFSGFGEVWEYPPALPGEPHQRLIKRTFRLEAALAGRLAEVVTHNLAGYPLNRTVNEYALTEVTGAGARRVVDLSAVWNEKYSGVTPCAAWPCAQGRRTKQEYLYDGYGNLAEVKHFGDFDVAGDETLTRYSNAPNATTYIVGLSNLMQQWSGLTTAGPRLKAVLTSYDDAAWNVPPTKGALTQLREEFMEESRYAVKATHVYDGYGNVTQSTDATNRSITLGYDAIHHMYPTSTTNAAGESTTTTWDFLCGVPVTTTDANNVTTTFATDALCRPTTTTLPGPYGVVQSQSYLNLGASNQRVRVETPGPDGLPQWTETSFDGFGRTYHAAARGADPSQPILSKTEFDARGNVRTKTAAYYQGETEKVTTFEYDEDNRPKKITLPDGRTRLTSYPGMSSAGYFKIEETNELGQVSVSKIDVLGRLIKSENLTSLYGTLATTRTYDILGRLVSVLDPQGNAWTYAYNSLGVLTGKDDPDAGEWTYKYDDAGRLLSQTDAKLQTMTLEYDAVGRARFKRTRPTGGVGGTVTEYVETTYGASSAAYNKGRVVNVVTKNAAGVEQSGKLAFEYDALGRVKKQTRTLDGTNYAVERNYDAAGYLRGMKYPDNDILGQFGGSGTPLGYDAVGRLTSIPGILNSVTYSALGAPLVQTNANGTTTTKTYDPDRFWLTDIETATSSLTLQDLHYDLNDAGMADSVESHVSNEDWTYGYDEMNRLTSASNGVPANNQTWQYDSLGRITYNSRVGSYTYGGPRPHAVTAAGGYNFTNYDANGNLVVGGNRTITWDANNLIKQVTTTAGSTTTFEYGPDGARIKKGSGAAAVRYPFGDDYEIAANGTVTKYFNAGFGPIAKKVGLATFWLHTDRLGSVNATTDAFGAEVLRRSYRSYGELLGQTVSAGAGDTTISEFATTGNPGTSKTVTVRQNGPLCSGPDTGAELSAYRGSAGLGGRSEPGPGPAGQSVERCLRGSRLQRGGWQHGWKLGHSHGQ